MWGGASVSRFPFLISANLQSFFAAQSQFIHEVKLISGKNSPVRQTSFAGGVLSLSVSCFPVITAAPLEDSRATTKVGKGKTRMHRVDKQKVYVLENEKTIYCFRSHNLLHGWSVITNIIDVLSFFSVLEKSFTATCANTAITFWNKCLRLEKQTLHLEKRERRGGYFEVKTGFSKLNCFYLSTKCVNVKTRPPFRTSIRMDSKGSWSIVTCVQNEL